VLAPPKKSLSPREKFFGYVTGYFDFLASHPNYPRLVQREGMEASLKFDRMLREYFRPLHRHLARTVEEGIAAGEFRKVDPDQTAFITLGMATSYFAAAPVMSRVVGHDLLAPQAIAARKHALLDFLHHAVVRRGVRSR
jgi:AcrR family transcriptional regulator